MMKRRRMRVVVVVRSKSKETVLGRCVCVCVYVCDECSYRGRAFLFHSSRHLPTATFHLAPFSLTQDTHITALTPLLSPAFYYYNSSNSSNNSHPTLLPLAPPQTQTVSPLRVLVVLVVVVPSNHQHHPRNHLCFRLRAMELLCHRPHTNKNQTAWQQWERKRIDLLMRMPRHRHRMWSHSPESHHQL